MRLLSRARGRGFAGVGGAAVMPALEEDFSTYSSTANMLADPRGIYSAEDVETGQMSLLTGDGYGSSPQAMRYTYPDRTALGSRCADYTIGRNLTLPTPTTEVWVDVRVRFSSGFLTLAPAGWGCASGAALKFMFGRVNGMSSRFQVIAGGNGGQQWETGYPTNEEPAAGQVPTGTFNLTQFCNGSWMRIRAHWKVGAGTGACELWIEDTKVISLPNVNTGATTNIYGIALGRNMNQGPGASQTLDWGLVRAYNTDPGWD